MSGPTANCPECKAPVYFVRGPYGGGAYFDRCGPPWPKHACTDKSKHYSPYGKTGKPKLRVKPSEFEKDGWLPFLVRNVESLGSGTIVHGVALDDPTILHFGTRHRDLALDRERPIFFRIHPDRCGVIEFNFFPLTSECAVSELFIDDCRTDFDLMLKTPP